MCPPQSTRLSGEVVARFQTLSLSLRLATLVRVCERGARFTARAVRAAIDVIVCEV